MARFRFSTLLAVAGFVAAASAAQADTFAATYGAPGAQSATSAVASGTSVIGTETFDSRPLGDAGFVTDYGTAGVITGTYSAGTTILNADLYGSAGGTGYYAAAINGTGGYSVNLATNGIPGVNYFGFWLSALDSGNELALLRGGVVVGSYTPADLLAAVGACPSASPYCGNPNPAFLGQDAHEPFAFVNLVDLTGYFDELRFSESPQVGNYESDNHTVGYCANAAACVSGTALPEPVSLAMLGVGLLGIGVVRRWGAAPLAAGANGST